MVEGQIPITLRNFRPAEVGARPDIQEIRLLRQAIGKERLYVCRGMQAGEDLSWEEAIAINVHALDSLRVRWGLPEGCDMQECYMQAQKNAIGVIKYYMTRLPEIAEDAGLKDEVDTISERPSDLMRLLFRKPESIDSTLSYEARRLTYLMDISGQINARTRNVGFRTILSDIRSALYRRGLFEGPEGTGKPIILESFHDNNTNTVMGFTDSGQKMPQTAHLKKNPFTARSIEGVGLVSTSYRKKDDRIAIIKALAKAKDNKAKGKGDVISIDNDVIDGMGIMFGLLEDRVTPAEFIERVVALIDNHPIETESGQLKLIDAKPDNNSGTDHGQAEEPSFNERRQLCFEGISIPVELIVSNRETFLNSRLEVGKRDSESGFHKGRSHELFENRRAFEVSDVLLPEEVYRPDFHAAFINRDKLIARDSRARHRAA